MSRQKSVLVIDDEIEILQIIRCILEEEGYRVITAPDGEIGLTKLAEETPDLVLTDLMMPRLSGQDLLQRVRLDPRWTTLPVVFMSCVGPPRVQGSAAWQSFLKKPFTIDQLLKTVEAFVQPISFLDQDDTRRVGGDPLT